MKIKPRLELDNIKFYGVEDLGILCPVCKKPDWDLVAEHGYHCICNRVQSPRRIGQSGYMHPCNVDMKNIEPAHDQKKPQINWNNLSQVYEDNYCGMEFHQLPEFIQELELEFPGRTLADFRCGFDGEALTIPMFDASGQIIGMHRRFSDGSKRTVSRSSLGLVDSKHTSDMLVVCEGFTDSATMRKMTSLRGCRIVGRASCNTGNVHIKELLTRSPQIEFVNIISDNDDPGKQGSHALYDFLLPFPRNLKIRLYYPHKDCKDVREQAKQYGVKSLTLLKLVKERK